MSTPDTEATRAAIGRNLRQFRLEAGLSQTAAGDAVGVSQTAWSRWEAGQQMPTIDELPVIARTLGVDPARIVDIEAA